MSQQKVLYFHPSNEMYGADRSLLRLVTSLDRDIYSPEVLVPNDLPYEKLLTQELLRHKIPYQELNMGILRRKYFTPLGLLSLAYHFFVSSFVLAKYVRDEEITLIHSNSTAILTGGFVSRLAGVPHVWHVREILTKPAWLNKAVANIINIFADTVVTVSESAMKNLVDTQPKLRDKITVVHNGIDTTRFDKCDEGKATLLKEKWAINENDVVVGMVGRINAWKGQHYLLDVIMPVLDKDKQVKLVMVGGSVPGDESHKEKLVDRINKSRVKNQIIVEEFSPDIPTVLSVFDIFVLPSIEPDPFPTVTLEAMAAGKPVVATKHGGPVEQVKQSVTGYLVSPTDSGDMRRALNNLIYSPSLRKEMGLAGKERVDTFFSKERYVQDIISLYSDIISKYQEVTF